MTYFLDTSALVKRYVPEPGSGSVQALFRKRTRRAVSRIAYAELAAAVHRLWRENRIDDVSRDRIWRVVDADFATFEVVEVRRAVIDRVPELVRRSPLRGYDAVQLASALTLRERVSSVELWAADDTLVSAARGEGLKARLVGEPPFG